MFVYNMIPLGCPGMSMKRLLWPPHHPHGAPPPISLILTINELFPRFPREASPPFMATPFGSNTYCTFFFFFCIMLSSLRDLILISGPFLLTSLIPEGIWGWTTLGSVLTVCYQTLGHWFTQFSSSSLMCLESIKPYRRERGNHKIGRKQVPVGKESILSELACKFVCFVLFSTEVW